jgi:hypothetical protein
MRSLLICKIVILSRSSPQETGTSKDMFPPFIQSPGYGKRPPETSAATSAALSLLLGRMSTPVESFQDVDQKNTVFRPFLIDKKQ